MHMHYLTVPFTQVAGRGSPVEAKSLQQFCIKKETRQKHAPALKAKNSESRFPDESWEPAFTM
jgi:hypothetical protein